MHDVSKDVYTHAEHFCEPDHRTILLSDGFVKGPGILRAEQLQNVA